MYTKTFHYDPETRDFAMYLDGELVGFADTAREAEDTLNDLVYDLLNRAAADAQATEPQPAIPTPAQVAAACVAMGEEFRDAAAAQTEQGNREAARDLEAASRAADKAAFYATEGAQLARWVGEALMVRSATTGGVVYAVRASGCCCEAGQRGRACWHMALRLGHERALAAVEDGIAAAA